jgi:hypothetical protein
MESKPSDAGAQAFWGSDRLLSMQSLIRASTRRLWGSFRKRTSDARAKSSASPPSAYGAEVAIATAKLNDIDPQAWLADALSRLPDHPANRIYELLPWNWHRQSLAAHAA